LLNIIYVVTYVYSYARAVSPSAVLSQGKPRDAAVHFDAYRILQRHRGSCGFSTTARISCWSLSADCSELGYLSKGDKY